MITLCTRTTKPHVRVLQEAKAKAVQLKEAKAAEDAEHAAHVLARALAHQQHDRPGPHLEFGSQRLVMMGVAGDDGATTVLTVTSTGTAATYFNWTRCDCSNAQDGDPSSSGEEEEEDFQDDGRAGSSSELARRSGQQRHLFYLPDHVGVILPGESREFVFTFRSPAAGIFSESWCLATTPPLPSMGLHHRTGQPVEVSCVHMDLLFCVGVKRLNLEGGCGGVGVCA